MTSFGVCRTLEAVPCKTCTYVGKRECMDSRLSMTTPQRSSRKTTNGDANQLSAEDRPAHAWYRFVLSFPPHLVRHYLSEFGVTRRQTVLDPFCGTGTTLVECRKLGIPSVGIEPTPMAFFASSVKVDWTPNPRGLAGYADRVAEIALKNLKSDGIRDEEAFFSLEDLRPLGRLRSLPPEAEALLLARSISPLPLHKTLVLLESLETTRSPRYSRHARLAFASALVNNISNLHFGPEVGVGPMKKDALVIPAWLSWVRTIANDLGGLQELPTAPVDLHCCDSRQLLGSVRERSIHAVITSPPYPNEKDYTRTTRLESVLLGFLRDKRDLRQLKEMLLRSNTRNVFKKDADDAFVTGHPEIERIARAIERRRVDLGKTSGFERLYHRVAKLYFGGMYRHLAELRTLLRPGAHLAYVVGDQASYLRVMIRTGELIADIASSLGYEVVRIDLFRTRLATATREQLREEVVVLRWPGEERRATPRVRRRPTQ